MRHPRQQKHAHRAIEILIGDQPLHHGRNFGILVGANRIEFLHARTLAPIDQKTRRAL